MPLDDDFKKIALEYGEKVYNEIYVSMQDPTQSIEGETLKVYNELRDWGWLDEHPVEDQNAHIVYVKMIAMQKYRHLRWDKAHPPKRKLTKWEIVTGRLGGKR